MPGFARTFIVTPRRHPSRHEIAGEGRDTVALMPHEMTAVLTLLLALVSAIGMLRSSPCEAERAGP